jgi:hypothetical protein
MAYTVLDIIKPAFRIAGLLGAPGRGLSPEEQTEGLEVLNAFLDYLKVDRCSVYAILRALFTLTPGKGVYTIGTSGTPDINAERPVRIDRASFVFTNITPNIEIPLQVLNEQEWQAVMPKSLTASVPSKLYYEPFVPNGTINLWAIPTVAYKMALYLWQTVNEFAAITDPLVIAPAYRMMLQYNLAVQLAERYPERQQISGTAVQRAKATLAEVRRANAPALLMRCESGSLGTQGGGRYDIRSNQFTQR